MLVEWDIAITQTINSWHTPFQDPIWAFISEKFVWIPLYAVLLFLLFKKLGWKKLAIASFWIILLIVFTDQFSTFVKHAVQRLRPCHGALADVVHTVNQHCGGKYGYFSSHASNAFGLAIFLSLIFKRSTAWGLLLLWATLQAYSRIYLGVHYLGDVLTGAIFGSLSGALCWLGFKKTMTFSNVKHWIN